jgi:hypothetical protein
LKIGVDSAGKLLHHLAEISLDDLGNRLAVGAPLHDYIMSATSTDPSFLNENGGAVVLYEFDGSHWNLYWFEHGAAGKQMEDRVAVSADGNHSRGSASLSRRGHSRHGGGSRHYGAIYEFACRFCDELRG